MPAPRRHGQMRRVLCLRGDDLEPVERVNITFKLNASAFTNEIPARTNVSDPGPTLIATPLISLASCVQCFEPAREQRPQGSNCQVAVVDSRIEHRRAVTSNHNTILIRRRLDCQQQTHTCSSIQHQHRLPPLRRRGKGQLARSYPRFGTNSKLIDKAFGKSCSTMSPHSTAVMLSGTKSSSARSRNSATLESR